MKIRFYSLILFSLLLVACSDDETLEVGDIQSFVFGHSYGECLGDDCIITFKIEGEQLFKDTYQQYGYCQNPNYKDDGFELQPDSSYQKVKDLISQIPAELLEQAEGTIGMPDAYDQGGIQIQITTSNGTKCWFIDNDDQNIPDFLHNFNDTIRDHINELMN